MARRLDAVDAQMTLLVLMWGSAFVGLKELGTTLDPYQMTWYRYVPFLVLYGVWLAFARRERFTMVRARDWPRFAAAGAVGVLGYHFPLNAGLHGEHGITAATAAVLVATTPLWALVMAVALRLERFDVRKAVGSAVAFAGVVVVVFLAPVQEVGFTAARTSLIVLLAPVLWAIYSFIAKPLIKRYGGLFTTGLTFCLGTLMLLPLGVSYAVRPLEALDGAQWFWLVFISVGATVLGYTIWNQALRQRSATEVTSWIYLVPLVATAVGWVLLDEAITLWFAVGAALVLGGLAEVHRARTREAALPAVRPVPEGR